LTIPTLQPDLLQEQLDNAFGGRGILGGATPLTMRWRNMVRGRRNRRRKRQRHNRRHRKIS
jgi:hypothetical protein